VARRVHYPQPISGQDQRGLRQKPRARKPVAGQLLFRSDQQYQASWRKALVHAIELGVPTPAFSTALAFFDGFRTGRLPANLLQAQRDYFGAHTYERIDQPRGQFFHTNWTGHGGRVSSSTYNA